VFAAGTANSRAASALQVAARRHTLRTPQNLPPTKASCTMQTMVGTLLAAVGEPKVALPKKA